MDNSFTYEFQPNIEIINLIGIPKMESSERKDGMTLWSKFKKTALQIFYNLRIKYPTKYKNGLHIYIGEYNDHLWLGFNNTGAFLTDIFMLQLEKNMPNEYFVIEQTTPPPIPMAYSYYPNKILALNTDCENGKTYKDVEYGTMLEITTSELFPESMKKL